VETVELEIEMDNELMTKARNLAFRYFGDDTDASLAQVLEVAFRMRCLWSRSIGKGQAETEEAVSKWEFPESPVTGENDDIIRGWLFRR
jgi:hypothetical protein